MSTKWDQVDWNSDTIIHLLTREWLHSYLAASFGDQDQALVLYDWNIRAAGAVLGFVVAQCLPSWRVRPAPTPTGGGESASGSLLREQSGGTS